jgi:hypothetical protein
MRMRIQIRNENILGQITDKLSTAFLAAASSVRGFNCLRDFSSFVEENMKSYTVQSTYIKQLHPDVVDRSWVALRQDMLRPLAGTLFLHITETSICGHSYIIV